MNNEIPPFQEHENPYWYLYYLEEVGIDQIDRELGDSKPHRFVSDRSAEWGRVARILMDQLYRDLQLPNNYQGDFWKDYGPQIESQLSKKQCKIVHDFYPNGDRKSVV